MSGVMLILSASTIDTSLQSISLVLVTFILASSISSGVPVVGGEPLDVSVQEFLYGFRITPPTCAIIAAGAMVISLGRGHN